MYTFLRYQWGRQVCARKYGWEREITQRERESYRDSLFSSNIKSWFNVIRGRNKLRMRRRSGGMRRKNKKKKWEEKKKQKQKRREKKRVTLGSGSDSLAGKV
jgi:hypothetical protein